LSFGTALGNFGGSVTLGGGADTFANSGNIAFVAANFNGGSGHDTIALDAGTVTNSTINGGNGFDFISVTGAGTYTNSVVFGGDGADTVSIAAAAAMTFTTIQSGDGHDRILATALGGTTSLVIAAGAGLDSIYLGASSLGSVAGGSGNDTIRYTGAVAASSSIFGDTLTTTESVTGDGNDVISISAAALGAAVSVYGAGGNDTIGLGNIVTSSLISAGAGDDVIGHTALTMDSASTITGGGGNDSININTLASGSFLLGADGNDTISLGFSALAMTGSVNGGAGTDLINARMINGILSGAVLAGTINGGDGNDTISFGSALLFSAAGGQTAVGVVYSAAVSGVITNIAYGSGDVIRFTGSFITAANWLANSAIYVSTSANGISAEAFTGAGGGAGVGSIGVFGYGNDLVFAFYSGSDQGSLVQYLNVVDGKSALLKNTTAVQTAITMNSTNFGFSVTSYQNGIQISFA